MILTSTQLAQLIAQARRAAPNETWGIIGGKANRALQIYPMKNVHAKTETRYVADPQELLQVLREIEDEKQWDILAIYHSHPATQPYPSPTDIAEAHYPDSVYIIISLQNPKQALVRGFRIVNERVSEITLEVEDESPRTDERAPARRANRPRAGRAVAPLSKRRPQRANARGTRRRISKSI